MGKRYSREKDFSRQLRKYLVVGVAFCFMILFMALNFMVPITVPVNFSTLNGMQISGPVTRYINGTQVIYETPAVIPYRGIVFIAHACTHGAYDFWRNSSTCKDCVGLTEEVAIVKHVLNNGYVAVVASSADRQYKCWEGPGGRDIQVIPNILDYIRSDLGLTEAPVYALGCSSGGPFVWLLAARAVVDGIIVQSFDIGDHLLRSVRPNAFPVIFNPMPKDKGTYNRVLKNIEVLGELGFTPDHIQIKPCSELPVTEEYLGSRLDFLTKIENSLIWKALVACRYVDSTTGKLLKDPTVDGGDSDWRKELTHRLPHSLLEKLVFTRGRSPLAKTLNRAWAFHEYCSDYVKESLEWLAEFAEKKD